MMNLAMEWIFRLSQEPRRLWKRYLSTNPAFVCLFLAEYFGFFPASAQGYAERLLRLACIPPLLSALEQGRLVAILLTLFMPAWLGRLFWLADSPATSRPVVPPPASSQIRRMAG